MILSYSDMNNTPGLSRWPKQLQPRPSHLRDGQTIALNLQSGVALLRHARPYTLADAFGLPKLKSLAHYKIHSTSSTATREIACARYVYRATDRAGAALRKPVAAY